LTLAEFIGTLSTQLEVIMKIPLALSTLLCIAPLAHANLLINGSFEQGTWVSTSSGYMDVPIGSTAITGWTTTDNRVAWAKTPTADGVIAQDGIYSLDLTGFGNLNPNAGVTQTINTAPGQQYLLTFEFDAAVGLSGLPAKLAVQAGSIATTFTKTTGGWEQFSLPFVATSSATAISLSGSRLEQTYYVGLDNVSVTSVPEPSSWALLVTGVISTSALCRKRRKIE
jgi:hypothetical protein